MNDNEYKMLIEHANAQQNSWNCQYKFEWLRDNLIRLDDQLKEAKKEIFVCKLAIVGVAIMSLIAFHH